MPVILAWAERRSLPFEVDHSALVAVGAIVFAIAALALVVLALILLARAERSRASNARPREDTR